MSQPKPMYTLTTPSGDQILQLRIADSFFSRLRGLMFAPPLRPNEAMLLRQCPSVHTCFMRAPIDVLYLDAQGTVTKCVSALKPWHVSSSRGKDEQGQKLVRARDTLELAAGSIARLGLKPGCQLRQHPAAIGPKKGATPYPDAGISRTQSTKRQRGSAMIEFAVVGPLITLLGLATLQYGMLFFAKNQFNHASFMAARAGSVGHANLDSVRTAYALALVPIYGGGQNASQLASSLAKAEADIATSTRIEMLNPTQESFATYNEPKLQRVYNTGSKRVIPNGSQAFKDATVDPSSGQSIQDANLIKLRITQGYKPQVPLMGALYKTYLQWQDTKTDSFQTALLADGRIPVVTHVMVQMQSDAIEPANPVSMPGTGNGGRPTDPGDPPVVTTPEPPCPPTVCAGGVASGADGPPPGSCPAPLKSTLSADTLFGFDQATLQPPGIAKLDELIAAAKASKSTFDTINVTGYADPLGQSEAYNIDLSQRRAQTVSNYLSSHGLTAAHVNVVGKGSADPVVALSACSGKTGAAQRTCLAPDRRVVVELIPKA